MRGRGKPKLAVWKFSSCDGCQLSLLSCEDELLAVAGAVEIAHFLEASSAGREGPYDLSLVEGSITTAVEERRIRRIRRDSRVLVTIGACATAGGIQALRNFADAGDYERAVYPRPEDVHALARSTAIAEYVPVDFELRGCPVDKHLLLELIAAFLDRRRPNIPRTSECVECKRRGTVCVMVADGIACLGPVTQAGCGGLCPATGRGCYGCFGPWEGANIPPLSTRFAETGIPASRIAQMFRSFNADAEAFRAEADRLEREAGGRAP
jgi:coenzyme F420-reducing hydrogenase gamma subunit